MRNTLLQFVVILLVAGAASAVDPNLVAWYQFDETGGLTAYDSARSHNGTINGATRVAGKIGNAMYFDGFSKVSVPSDQELNITGDITIAAWVNFYEGGLGSDGSQKAIVTKCVNHGTINNPYDFRTSANPETMLCLVRANNFQHETDFSEVGVPLNSWHNVAVVVENMAVAFYIDGVLTGTEMIDPLSTAPTGNEKPLLIGARDDGFGFKGLIDDVRIYNRALSGEEIGAIPEPCTLLLLGFGSAIAAGLRKKPC
jgi:hypothetical protein